MSTVIFQDNFTEGADVDLTAHTPSPTGTSWTQTVVTGAVTIRVYSATDNVGGSTNLSSSGQLCQAAPTPSQYDIDIEYTMVTLDTGSATRPIGVVAHMSDATPTNYYRTRHLPTGHASNDTEIMEMAGGTKTSLATVDTGLVGGDLFKFSLRANSQELFKNGASILSSADTSLSTPGPCGIAIGTVKTGDTGNMANTWRLDDFIITEITAGAAAGYMTTMRGFWGT